jgi:hypothetical protein
MSISATADWRRIAQEPALVRELERPTTAQPSKYRLYAKLAESLQYAIERHWDDMDERYRHLLRVSLACTLEPQHVFSPWEKFVSNAKMSTARLLDRDAVNEYLTAIHAVRKAVTRAVEGESEGYHETLRAAIAEVTNGTASRPSMTAREASELVRAL